MNKVKVHSLR